MDAQIQVLEKGPDGKTQHRLGTGAQVCAFCVQDVYSVIHAYMHTYIHAYMHTCIHAYMHTCTHAYMHTCIHAYMHTCPQAVAGLWLVW